MKRTVCVATNDGEIVGFKVVEGHLYAEDLQSVYHQVREYQPHKLGAFYKTLGFESLRRSTDLVCFFDLELELDQVTTLPDDLLRVVGISN